MINLLDPFFNIIELLSTFVDSNYIKDFLFRITESIFSIGVSTIKNFFFHLTGSIFSIGVPTIKDLFFYLTVSTVGDIRLIWETRTGISIAELVHSTDVTPKLTEKVKEKRVDEELPVVDITYTTETTLALNNRRTVLLLDVLDSTGTNLKNLYPGVTIRQMPCTFHGQPWVGLKFTGSSIDTQGNRNSELFKQTTYTNPPVQYIGCWVPRPNRSLTQNTIFLSAASAPLISAEGLFLQKDNSLIYFICYPKKIRYRILGAVSS